MPLTPTPGISNLLLGCVQEDCVINLPIEAENIAPFVRMSIDRVPFAPGRGGLTVGNESCPNCGPPHSAIIKSFEYGMSDGQVLKFVIHDQAGGSFTRVFESLNTDFCQLTTDYTASATWGWTGVKCNRQVIISESDPITFVISSISTNMSSGKIEYEIEGADLFRGMMQSRAFKTIGDDENPVKLKEAIRRLMSEPPQPLISSIRYLRRLPDGKIENWEFKKEPEGTWEPANRNKIACALDWLRNYLTDQDRGNIDYTWDSGNSTPGIIFWEDLTGRAVTCSPLGTYIVNGGAFSPVISFQPKFQWNFTNVGRAGGSSNAGSSSPADKHNSGGSLGDSDPCKKGAGVQIGANVGDHEDAIRNDGFGPQANEKQMDASAKQNKARTPLAAGATGNSISADLVIQGDPTISTTQDIYKNQISLIVVNPFYLSGPTNLVETNRCPDWTIRPPCNEVGSNSKWRVVGINHSINQGSYVTTLKLFLAAPGADIDEDAPLGG